jgi:hypothetical protein
VVTDDGADVVQRSAWRYVGRLSGDRAERSDGR